MQWITRISYLNARVDVNYGRKDGRTDEQTERRKTGRLYRNLAEAGGTK